MRNATNAKPTILSVIGWSGVGKTTFIESALEECAKRGITAAALKKSRHEADLPPDAKDSSRFHAAGATPSIYLSESDMVILTSRPALMDAASIEDLCPRASLIFCEGLDVPSAPIVLVAGTEREESGLKRPLSSIDILIARDPGMIVLAESRSIAAFPPEAVGRFIDYLVS